MLKLGILISGRGSNMAALLRAARAGRLAAEPAIVISDRDAPGLAIAERMGVRTRVIPARGFSGSRRGYDARIEAALRGAGVGPRGGLVCLAGFMRILGPDIVRSYAGRILNIHPALLPAFPGLHAQRQALEYGARVTGCTVHFVDAGVDTGPVIVQRAVRVRDNDTEETLSARILAREHGAYVEAASLVADGRVRLRRGLLVRS